MFLPQDSKAKSAQIDWGYFNRSAPTSRARFWLWILAALLVTLPLTGLTIAAALSGQRPQSFDHVATRGPLTAAHAGLDQQCEACHQPFERIRGGSWTAELGGWIGISSRSESSEVPVNSWRNERCEACHAGAIHHPRMNLASENLESCAGCHREHQGRDFNLTQLNDQHCTGCHANLPPHAIDPKGIQVAAKIEGFATDHPEFRQLSSEPDKKHVRMLKFSHAVHMQAGMGLGVQFKFRDMEDPADRQRYLNLLGQSNSDMIVQLECSSCHQLSSSRPDGAASAWSPAERFAMETWETLRGLPREPLRPSRESGAVFLPINFETHCKGCHPLTFDESDGLRGRVVPHRLQPDEIERFLREVYSSRYLNDHLAPPATVDRPVQRLDPLPRTLDAEAKKLARQQVDNEVAQAMQTLFVGNKTCLECHQAVQPLNPSEGGRPNLPTAILSPNIPTVWQPRARFDHASHRGMNCKSCHPASYATDADGTGYQSPEVERKKATSYAAAGTAFPHYQHPPDLPSIAICRECHAPPRSQSGTTVAGVSHRCTDCHSYHHADRWLQSVGSPWNDPPRGSRDLLHLLNALPPIGSPQSSNGSAYGP
mgnify:CR=1 FL=1